MAITVREVTMVLPDLIKIEVREPAVDHVGLVAVASPPDAGAYGAWLDRSKTTGGAGSDKALVAGSTKNWLKFEDVRTTEYLDREAALVAGDWGTIGGLTVTAVYLKSLPYDFGECFGDVGTQTTKAASFKHYLYLQLSDDLAQGTHTIDFPTDTGISDYSFTFNDRVTRFAGFKCNQHGHTPSDLMKFAYISEWIPGYGTEGRVDFSGISNWHIMDRHGVVVWSAGAAPVLRVNATDVEPNCGIQPADSRLHSTTQPVRNVIGYTNANPCVITYTGDDLTNGMIVRINGLIQSGGTPISPLNSRTSEVLNHTIANVDNSNPSAKTAELQGVDRSAATATWVSGGLIYETQATVNRAGTNVYGLDYTAFEPAEEGIYYLFIPGYGVSHPIYIDNAVYYKLAHNFAKGEYHQRHWIPIDGRFGFSRQAGWNPATQIIHQNLLPLAFSTEVGITGGGNWANPAHCGLLASTFHTATTVDYIPGHHDAGDHDSRMAVHMMTYYGYMDFYDQFPAAAEATDWNIPTMVSLFPLESRYDGTEILCDCLQQALFALHGYIESLTTGASDFGANFVSGGANQSATTNLVPSWLERSGADGSGTTHSIFLYAPDHVNTANFVTLCAKLAICLRKWDTRHSTTTFATLAQYYEDLAVDCFAACEYIYDAGSAWGSGSTSAVDDARTALYDSGGEVLGGGYKTACDAQSASWFTSSAWDEVNTAKYSTAGTRWAALGALYRCTGDIAYGDIITNSSVGVTAPKLMVCVYEYCLASHANVNASKQATYKAAILSYVDTTFVDHIYGDIGFKSLRRISASGSFGNDGTDWENCAMPVVAALVLSERDSPGSGADYRKCLEDGFNYLNGANLTNLCLVTGMGSDTVGVFLHADSMAQGNAVPVGFSSYGPCDRGVTAALSLQNGPLNWITQDSPLSLTADYEQQRAIYPIHFAWPQHEHFIESPGMIEMSEYVYAGSVGPMQWCASVLYALGDIDLTIATDVPAGRTRGNAITS